MAEHVDAIVKGPNPFFYDSLFQPGERVSVDLDRLGITSLDQSDALDAAPDGDALVEVGIAPVAPHAPNPNRPQGFPAGGKIGAGGDIVHPDGSGGTIKYVPAGSEAPAPVVPGSPVPFDASNVIDGNVQDVTPRLAGLTDEQLVLVEDAEKAREKPRAGLLTAIDEVRKTRS